MTHRVADTWYYVSGYSPGKQVVSSRNPNYEEAVAAASE
jgi:hypothetical protein